MYKSGTLNINAHSTKTFAVSSTTVRPLIFLEILKRVGSMMDNNILWNVLSCSSVPTYILLSDHPSSVSPRLSYPEWFQLELMLRTQPWRSADQEDLFLFCSEQLLICTASSPHLINSKINTCSIYFSCLFEKMKWVNRCKRILRKLKVLDSYMRLVILSEHDANLYYETSI